MKHEKLANLSMRQLLRRQDELRAELSAMNDAAPDTMDGEMQSAWDALEKALADVRAAIGRRSVLDEAERSAAGPLIGGTGDRHLDREVRAFSLTRLVAGAAGLPGVDWGREREISAEIARRSGRPFSGHAVPLAALSKPVEQRVVSTTTPTSAPGGSLIATMLDGSQYIDILRSALKIRSLGARVLSGLTSNVDLPRLQQSAAAGWVAENTTLTVSDEGFNKVPLRPHHAGAVVELSRNVLQQSTPDIETLVRADLAAVLARVLDAAAIAGTGTANDPTGILNSTGIGGVALGTNGGPITWASVLSLIETVATANAPEDGRAFLSNPKIVAQAMQTPKVSGVALGFVADAPDMMAGYPLAQTNLVPSNLTKGQASGTCSALIFGSWAELIIGLWSELDVLVNPYETTAYQKGNVQVRAMLTCDIALRHPQSFAAITDCTAT